MAWIKPEDIARAKSIDLLTYLKNYDPGELVHDKGNTYHTKTHDSLKISNGMWMWWSEGVGGKSALDYLIKVQGLSFMEAVETILGEEAIRPAEKAVINREKKSEVYIPERYELKSLNSKDSIAFRYLAEKRGIDEDILREQYALGNWYQAVKTNNVAFVGRDETGKIKLISQRGTMGDYKNTTAGSDRRYPFVMRADKTNKVLHLFESPIDALSYASVMKKLGMNYRDHNLIGLCGIYRPKENIEESSIPVGLKSYLESNSYTNTICLHLDTDGPGKASARALQVVLSNKGMKVINQPPPEGFKDCNDFLLRGMHLLIRERGEKDDIEIK